MILDCFPTPNEFYKAYWNKKPFIVRGYIQPELILSLIDGDELAGLALEEDVTSRIITNTKEGDSWTCEHGPFKEERFADLTETNWSLLVQHVDQHHFESSLLLKQFDFSPRWLLEDIMVSYSAPGGSVGPHIDSYHTFLVQGVGKRIWQLSDHIIEDDECIEGAELKILKNGFKGKSYEVSIGDVIYVPPFFGHSGETIEAAMTFSIGFLGPKLSEMIGDYAQYLEQHEQLDKRYYGAGLDVRSSGFSIASDAIKSLREQMIESFQSDSFSIWLAQYFSTPTHDVSEHIDAMEDAINAEQMMEALHSGEDLVRLEHVKLAITTTENGAFHLGFLGEGISIPANYETFINVLNTNNALTLVHVENDESVLTLVVYLYNRGVLIFSSELEDS